LIFILKYGKIELLKRNFHKQAVLMLLRFSLENWMSFRDPVSFSMIASQERQHGDRIAKVDKYQMRVLPIAAIYGVMHLEKPTSSKA
jgi:hypothetical protein